MPRKLAAKRNAEWPYNMRYFTELYRKPKVRRRADGAYTVTGAPPAGPILDRLAGQAVPRQIKPKRKPPTKAQVRAMLKLAAPDQDVGYDPTFAAGVEAAILWMLGQGEEPLR